MKITVLSSGESRKLLKRLKATLSNLYCTNNTLNIATGVYALSTKVINAIIDPIEIALVFHTYMIIPIFINVTNNANIVKKPHE